MTNPLDALLGAELKIEKDVFIKRLDTSFTIRAIDNGTINRISDQASEYVGKGNKRKKEIDHKKFNSLLILHACVAPDFRDKKLLEKFNVPVPEEVVDKALLAGEVAKLSAEIMEISGYSDDDDSIAEVKN